MTGGLRMIKLVYVIRSRDDVPRAEFHRYWREEHAAKVKAVAQAIRATRYVQSHTLQTPLNDAMPASRGMIAAYEGITELWWDSMEDFTAAITSEAGAAAVQMLADDEETFIDIARSTYFLTEEIGVY
jgi:uncharacterized protein (TIGR02118 family)